MNKAFKKRYKLNSILVQREVMIEVSNMFGDILLKQYKAVALSIHSLAVKNTKELFRGDL